jgi:hypothetical protein
MLARSATAGQATFEPDEDEDEEPDDEEDEEPDDEEPDDEEPDDEEPDDEELGDEDEEPLPTVSEAFLPLLPGLSPDESALDAPSDFLASEPLDEALAASESFCAARLSVR